MWPWDVALVGAAITKGSGAKLHDAGNIKFSVKTGKFPVVVLAVGIVVREALGGLGEIVLPNRIDQVNHRRKVVGEGPWQSNLGAEEACRDAWLGEFDFSIWENLLDTSGQAFAPRLTGFAPDRRQFRDQLSPEGVEFLRFLVFSVAGHGVQLWPLNQQPTGPWPLHSSQRQPSQDL